MDNPNPRRLAESPDLAASHSTSQPLDPATESLNQLLANIAELHESTSRLAIGSALMAIETGVKLRRVKEHLPHRQFSRWVRDELTPACGMTLRTAQRYMRLAKHLPDLLDRLEHRTLDADLDEARASSVLHRMNVSDAVSLLKIGRPPADDNSAKKEKRLASRQENQKTSGGEVQAGRSPSPPPEILAAAELFFRDPAGRSVAEATPTVREFTSAEQGLSDDSWTGCVFVHSIRFIDEPHWAARAVSEYATHSVSEALILLSQPTFGQQPVDSYPHVFFASDCCDQALVALVPIERLPSLKAAFSSLGNMFVPYASLEIYHATAKD